MVLQALSYTGAHMKYEHHFPTHIPASKRTLVLEQREYNSDEVGGMKNNENGEM